MYAHLAQKSISIHLHPRYQSSTRAPRITKCDGFVDMGDAGLTMYYTYLYTPAMALQHATWVQGLNWVRMILRPNTCVMYQTWSSYVHTHALMYTYTVHACMHGVRMWSET